jgi:parvulin-like peptidyl-prolyl isomerase
MRFQWFVCLVLASLAFGQAAPATPPPSAAPNAASSTPAPHPQKTLAPDETVLTVKGVCADSGKQAADCKTAITRAQFEKLTDSIQPNMPMPIRRNVANQYSVMLLMSAAAEKRGLDKGPKFEEAMHLARMQILARELSRALKDDSEKISDTDFEEYYRKNAANFEQADVLKLYLPHNKQIVNSGPDEKEEEFEAKQKAGEEEMKKLAETLHARAAKGEDFEKLQKEAFEAAGFKGAPPDPKMNNVRRTTLPPKQVVAMDLKPNEVSELISDPTGYYVFKMVSKKNLPLEAVKEEIRGTLSAQRYRDAMQAFQKTDNAELNDAYFGPAPKPPVPQAPRGGKAPEQGEEDHK